MKRIAVILIILYGCGLFAQTKTDDKFVCSDGTKCQLENGEGSACVCTPTSVKVTVCGKYQHAEAGHMSTLCQSDICMDGPYVPAYCAEDLHVVTEREWRKLLARLKALEAKRYVGGQVDNKVGDLCT